MQITNYTDYISDWMHLERYVNSGSDHKFKNQSDVPQLYRPGSQTQSFQLMSLAGNSHIKEEDLLPEGIYPVHPYTSKIYQSIGHTLESTSYNLVPTSSTRTMLIYKDDPANAFFVKLDIPVKISRFNRAISRSDVVFSSQIDAEITRTHFDSEFAFGIFREVGGGHTILNDGRNAGYLVRELYPTWLTDNKPGKYFLVPSFSMISPDIQTPQEPPLLIQILRKSDNPTLTLCEKIIFPLLQFWFALADRGMLWEMQQQNTLFVLDADHNPIGIVIRDYDGTYLDAASRQELGLDTLFIKHLLWNNDDRTIRYSNIFDHRVCKQNILRLINCYGEHFSAQEAAEVKAHVSAYIEKNMPKRMASILPQNRWYTVPETLFKEGIQMQESASPPFRP